MVYWFHGPSPLDVLLALLAFDVHNWKLISSCHFQSLACEIFWEGIECAVRRGEEWSSKHQEDSMRLRASKTSSGQCHSSLCHLMCSDMGHHFKDGVTLTPTHSCEWRAYKEGLVMVHGGTACKGTGWIAGASLTLSLHLSVHVVCKVTLLLLPFWLFSCVWEQNWEFWGESEQRSPDLW